MDSEENVKMESVVFVIKIMQAKGKKVCIDENFQVESRKVTF